jgi:hypothetical protein
MQVTAACNSAEQVPLCRRRFVFEDAYDSAAIGSPQASIFTHEKLSVPRSGHRNSFVEKAGWQLQCSCYTPMFS